MTTSLTALRKKVLENFGYFKTGTLTTSSATVPADTALADNLDTTFADWYLTPTAGTYAGVSRKLQTFTQTGGVMTPYTAFAGATGTVAYLLSAVDPADILLKINQAVQEIYPALWVPNVDEFSIITGNILPNALPADWAVSTTPDKWTVTGLTASQATTASLLRVGSSGLKMVSGGSDQTVMCTNSGNKYLSDLAGKAIVLKAWVYATDASKVALRLYDTAQTLSSYHAGDSKWHLLTISETLAQDPTNVSLAFGYYIATTGITAYAQQARITGVNIYKYLLPTSFPTAQSVHRVYLQVGGNINFTADTLLADCDAVGESVSWQELSMHTDWDIEDDGTDKWLVFKCTLPTERRLKIEGDKYATVLSAETDTVEFNAPQTNIIAAKAAALLFRAKASDTADKNYARYEGLANRWEVEARTLQVRHGIARPSRMTW